MRPTTNSGRNTPRGSGGRRTSTGSGSDTPNRTGTPHRTTTSGGGSTTPNSYAQRQQQYSQIHNSGSRSNSQNQQQQQYYNNNQQQQQQQQQHDDQQYYQQQVQQSYQQSRQPSSYQQQNQQQQGNKRPLTETERLEEELYTERFQRDNVERKLLLFEETSAAEKIEEDEAHERRMLEMYLVAGFLREDRHVEFKRDHSAVEVSCTPAVVEQLRKTAQHVGTERAVVETLRRQLDARLSAQRAAANKEREKVNFYRTMLIRRMRQLEDHVRMVCGQDHWLLKLPELADRVTNQPFMTAAGLRLHASPQAKSEFGVGSPDASVAGGGNAPHIMAQSTSSPNSKEVVVDPHQSVEFAKMLNSAAHSKQQQDPNTNTNTNITNTTTSSSSQQHHPDNSSHYNANSNHPHYTRQGLDASAEAAIVAAL